MTIRPTLNDTTDDRLPFDVSCKLCRYRWTAAWTPLPLGRMGELLKGLHCPKCGGDSKTIFHD